MAFVQAGSCIHPLIVALQQLTCQYLAVGMKIIGMLLVVALVIIPAAAARRIAATPEQMVGVATMVGVVAVTAGLFGSLEWNLPAGPAIVLVAGAVFVASLLLPARGHSDHED